MTTKHWHVYYAASVMYETNNILNCHEISYVHYFSRWGHFNISGWAPSCNHSFDKLINTCIKDHLPNLLQECHNFLGYNTFLSSATDSDSAKAEIWLWCDSDWFSVESAAVQQGCKHSPHLFLLPMDHILRHTVAQGHAGTCIGFKMFPNWT